MHPVTGYTASRKETGSHTGVRRTCIITVKNADSQAKSRKSAKGCVQTNAGRRGSRGWKIALGGLAQRITETRTSIANTTGRVKFCGQTKRPEGTRLGANSVAAINSKEAEATGPSMTPKSRQVWNVVRSSKAAPKTPPQTIMGTAVCIATWIRSLRFDMRTG